MVQVVIHNESHLPQALSSQIEKKLAKQWKRAFSRRCTCQVNGEHINLDLYSVSDKWIRARLSIKSHGLARITTHDFKAAPKTSGRQANALFKELGGWSLKEMTGHARAILQTHIGQMIGLRHFDGFMLAILRQDGLSDMDIATGVASHMRKAKNYRGGRNSQVSFKGAQDRDYKLVISQDHVRIACQLDENVHWESQTIVMELEGMPEIMTQSIDAYVGRSLRSVVDMEQIHNNWPIIKASARSYSSNGREYRQVVELKAKVTASNLHS